MNAKLFRQVSIERLSSPEQLDQVLRVTSFRTWLILAAVFAVLGVVVTWGYAGSIPTTATGEGVIVRRGGVLNIVARGAGVILDIRAKPGDKIRPDEVIATIAQPELMEKLRATRNALEDAKRQRVQNFEIQKDAARLQVEALERDRTNVQLQITELQERLKYAGEQIKSEEQLLAKGLVTKQQVNTARQAQVNIQQEIDGLAAKLKQFDAQEYSINAQPQQTDLPAQANVASIERDLAGLQQQLNLAERVVSPYGGEILESKVYPGSSVASGQALFSIQPDAAKLEVVAYVPSSQAKDIHQGLEVQISPMNIKREEYGFMRGVVNYIADYPSTPEALMRNFQNSSLVAALSQAGPVSEIHASIKENAATPTGFEWSTSQGPPSRITSGTICFVEIVTKRQRPVSLVFPYLKKQTGLG
ncbi:MAG TPA: NHLP bacteriocin system secretion protein [Bryobacteraceae bacterium]|jgi:HlyD family secretion protein|nr:NHLP bacteriocin system secretion protein [Bryobacteraceae bacterium]